jgi:CheY-like chemotaxis protein
LVSEKNTEDEVHYAPILIADDDPDDRMLAMDALEECQIKNALYQVEDGEELMDYLYRRGRWSSPEDAPRPGLILLDLNMPRKNGREALAEIKSDPSLKNIPIVVLTTSEAEEDAEHVARIGAEDFVTKPVTFNGLVRVMERLTNEWLNGTLS